MKTLMLSLAIIALAVSAHASESTRGVAPEQVTLPPLQAESYCQPPHEYLQAMNACTTFDSEVADGIAYCLSSESAGDGEVVFEECYIDGGIITGYFFYVTAGTQPIDDVEICAFIDGEYALVWNCSVPGSWYCHFDEGSHCVYWHTLDNPIGPGETYGPFDIWIDPPYCYPTLTVIWTLTLDGTVVAGPDTSRWHCGPTDTQPSTWGMIKALYK